MPLSSITSLVLNGSALADTFTFNFDDGDFLPPGGITVNGGAPSTPPGDTIAVEGAFTSVDYDATNVGAGTVDLGIGIIAFTGIEPLDFSGATISGTLTVDIDPGNTFAGNVITTIAAVDAGVNTEVTFGTSGLESIKFGAVTGAVVINGDNVEQDYFVLNGLGSAMVGAFTIDGKGGDADVIEINNTTVTVAGVDKAVVLRADFVGVGRANQDANTGVLNFKGPLTIEANGDFTVVTPLWGASGVWGATVPTYFPSSATMSARGNAIIKGELNKTGGADATVLIKATAGITTAGAASVPVTTGGRIISTSNKAHITLNADSDANSVGHVTVGLFSTLTSNGGDITIGGGADPATTPAFGFNAGTTLTPGVVLQSCAITSGGGAISVRGSGFAASGGHGIFCVSGNSANVAISSGSGNITMSGTSGALTGLHGISQQNSSPASTLISTTTGNISLTGAASLANGDGIRLVGRTSVASSSTGAISLTGTGLGTSFGVNLNPSTGNTTTVENAGGNITLTADTMNLNNGLGTERITTGSATAGAITLKPLTTGKNIELGSGALDSATLLAIDSGTELTNLTAGTVSIGEAASGTLTVSSVIAPSTFTTLALASGSGTTFSATSGFTSDVTSSSNYEKITVLGTVNITAGAALGMASTGYVWNGTDSFTILANDLADAITGTFTGPTLANFLGSALTAQESYTAGTGNDLAFGTAPTVTSSTAPVLINATTLIITGTGFSTTPGNNVVTLSNGATGVVTAATSTQLTVTLGTPAIGSLTAVVNNGFSSGAPVQVATIIPVITPSSANLAANAGFISISGFGFDSNRLNNGVTFSGAGTGTFTPTAASPTGLGVGLPSPLVAGVLNASMTSNGVSSGTAVQVATITPVVTSSTASLAANATTVTINGAGFDPTALNNTVTFNNGAVGTVTSASNTALTVTFNTNPTSAGSLTAVVTTNSVSSGSAVQVATVTPVVTLNTATIHPSAPTIVINGFGFSATPASNAVTFTGVAAGTVTAATPTQLTVTFSVAPSVGDLNAIVSVNGQNSGSFVQVATVSSLTITSSSASLAQNATQLIINGTGFSTTLGNNSVVLSSGTATVTAATATQLTCTLGGSPSLGALNATVTVTGNGSTGPTQVATIVAAPTVTLATTSLPIDSTTVTIAGSGFDSSLPGNNTVTFNNGATGTVTSATATSLTVTFGTKPTAVGSLTAVVTSFGGSSGAAVQVASVVDVVSIAATTATAVEGGATGLYTFTRGASTGDLTVSFQLDASSTATAATDFTLTSSGTLTFDIGTGAGSVIIPDGQLSATVTLTALVEAPNGAEAAETARLNVVAASGYVVGSPANATVTITENSFLVTNTTDSALPALPATGSLRQAVQNANTIAGTDTITFDPTAFATPQTITLQEFLPVSSSLTLQGPAARVTLSGGNTGFGTGLLSISTANDAVTLADLTIAESYNYNGGGGAISANGSSLTILRCTLRDNRSDIIGGGIFVAGGSLLVKDSTISGNTAAEDGGGIFIDAPGATSRIINSTISGNHTDGQGGGIYNAKGLTYVVNSTITGNSAFGTGVGGVFTYSDGNATTRLANSLVVGNTGSGGDVGYSTSHGTNNNNLSLGGNLVGTGNSAVNFPGETTAAAANTIVGPLADNGGPTRTHALIAGSPALNAGTTANAVDPVDAVFGDGNDLPLTTDQRGAGFTRAIGTVDIGAFELQKSVSIGNLAAISEGNSGTTNFVFTISRTGPTTGAVSMTYTVSGTAVNAADFGGTLPTGTATIPDGSATTTVTIPVSGDTMVEPDEAFTVTLSAPNNDYIVLGAPATSMINNDDAATVSIAKITDGAEANTPTSGKLRVTQTAASSTDTTLSYSVTGTATSGTDFTALSGSVTILAGQTTADIDATVLNDGTTLESTETVIATLTAITSGSPSITLGSTLAATMDITDDDTATVTIATIDDGNEPSSNGRFRVTQTAAATVDTVLTYTVGGTATSGGDFTALSGSVTITAGNTSADIVVPVIDENLVEGDETVLATLTGFTARDTDVSLGATLQATVTISDNDNATVSIAKIDDGAEPSTNGLFRVTQTAPSSTNTVVTYAVTGSATSGSDFTALIGSVTILAGQTTADISVPVIDENLVEATETVIATLNGFGAHDADITLGAIVADTVNITDNDTATVTLAKIDDGVEAASPTNALFRVTQTAAASIDTVISYTVGGTATSGSDFTALSGSVTILAGQTTADISVAVLNENVVEATETVSLTLTSIVGDPEVTLGVTTNASANITDSDTSVITLAAVSADKVEGTGGATTAFTFSATLSNPVQGGFSIAYTTNDGTALAGSDYTDNDGMLTFAGTAAESQTITVLVTHDGTNEIEETFTVALGAISGTTLSGSLSTAGSPQTGTIRNDDALTITITATDADADENSAGTGTWRITRNGVLGANTIQLAIDASSTAVAADWTQSGATFASLAPGSTGTAIIPDGDTFVDITLTPSADIHAEAAETARLNITADAAYVIGSPGDATVTIGQNDFVVINTDDAGEGSLRQAVLNANAIAGADTITFADGPFTDAAPDTITLTDDIQGMSELTIQGPTSARVILNGNNVTRPLLISSGKALVTDLDLTSGNSGIEVGGGVYVESGAELTLLRCSVTGCTSSYGGGIVSEGTLTVMSSTISGNVDTNSAASATAGGIVAAGTAFTLVNSTVSGNSAPNAPSNSTGGISASGTVLIQNSTITANSVPGAGANLVGGLTYQGGGTITIANSIVAGNADNATKPDVGGTFTSSGGNLIGNAGTATGFTGTNDIAGTGASPVDPLLGLLADNGGPTLTHMLLNGSPAINNGLVANLPADTFDVDGNSNTAEVLPVDQRGTPNVRQRGPAPDSGAYEAFAFEPAISAANTDEDTQTSSGIVITANSADGGLTTHYQITGILNGTLYQNDGTTEITDGSYITLAQGLAGLKFTPDANLSDVTTVAGFGFTTQAAIGATAGDLRGATVATVIPVDSVADNPSVTAATTVSDTQTTSGLVITINPVDGKEVTHFKISNILNGALFQNNGTTAISNGSFITVADGSAGLKFTPTSGFTGTATFDIQAATDGTGTGLSGVTTASITVAHPEPALSISVSPILNLRTGLFEQVVTVTNSYSVTMSGLRLTVVNLAPGIVLYNRTHPYLPVIEDPTPLAPMSSRQIRVQFYNGGRLLGGWVPEYRVQNLSSGPAPLPGSVDGLYHGLVDRSPTAKLAANPDVGMALSATVAVNGMVTGSLTEGTLVRPFSGKLTLSAEDLIRPQIRVTVPRTNLELRLFLNEKAATLDGSLSVVGTVSPPVNITGWRRVWSNAAPATEYRARHNVVMENQAVAGPQGYSYASISVTNATGSFTLAGRMADGSVLTGTSFVGPVGQVRIYKPLYGNRGSVLGTLIIDKKTATLTDNNVTGSLTWLKPGPTSPASKDTIYKAGFGPVTLNSEGGYYAAPAAGQRVLGLPATAVGVANEDLGFTLGGLDVEVREFVQGVRIYNPKATGRTNSAVAVLPNANKVVFTSFNAATGTFSGTFVLPAVPAVVPARTVIFYGQIVPSATLGNHGFGYFLLPQIPILPQTILTSPKLSGRIEL